MKSSEVPTLSKDARQIAAGSRPARSSRVMLRVASKLGQSLVTLFLALVLIFLGVRALPGDPALAMAGPDATPEAVEAVREHLGLTDPLPVQFVSYVGNLLAGDWGQSSSANVPVVDLIGRAIPVSLQLAIFAMTVAAVAGILLGVVAAVRQGKSAEWLANGLALLGLSVPSFWMGLMGILLFSVVWQVLPSSGYVSLFEDPVENLKRMVMPSIVLATVFAAIIMRQTRSAMLESLSADYIRTAKAKGMGTRQVLFGHALRNSLIVVVTVVGLHLGGLIGGAMIVETVFVIPGLGKLTVDAVFNRDYALIQGAVLVGAAAYIVVNLLTDVLYSIIDPRIRLTGGAS